jgi:mRNA-degrading endonuclease RelE of RelBE toxin-antitoxin system
MLLPEKLVPHHSYGTSLMSEPQVDVTAKFKKNIKSLKKKYQDIQDDVQPVIDMLKRGELPGDRLMGLDLEIYKIRLRNRNVNRGKSGGYRLIYYVKIDDCDEGERIVLVTIYSKSEQEDIDASEIKDIIAEFV